MIEMVECSVCGIVTTHDDLVVVKGVASCPMCKTDDYLTTIMVDEDALVLTAHNIVSDEVVETQVNLDYDGAIIAIAEHINRINAFSGYSLADWRIYEGRGKTLKDKVPANLYIMDELVDYIDKVVE